MVFVRDERAYRFRARDARISLLFADNEAFVRFCSLYLENLTRASCCACTHEHRRPLIIFTVNKAYMNKYSKNPDIRVFYCSNLVKDIGMPPALLDLERQDGVVMECVPCSGKIDPRYLLKAFEGGSRLVCILTCPKGECELIEGNIRAAKRVQSVKEILAEAGFNPESLKIFTPEGNDVQQVKTAVELAVNCINSE